MKTTTCPNTSAGFSLIEAIVSLFIIGTIVLVIANIPQVISLVQGTQSDSKVREVVAKKIEDIRLLGFDNLANGSTSITDSRLESLGNATGVVLTEDCPEQLCPTSQLADRIKKITITVTWNDNAEPKRFSVTTLVARGGLK